MVVLELVEVAGDGEEVVVDGTLFGCDGDAEAGGCDGDRCESESVSEDVSYEESDDMIH